jgi:hypothetical protein
MPNSVFEKLVQGGAKVVEKAAPVAGGIIGGAFGGPAGAAAGAAAGRGLASGVKKISSARALGGQGTPGGHGTFTPSSAGSLPDAKAQDRVRMKRQYGIGGDNIG